MVWTKEEIQYFRSEKDQRALLIEQFPFFRRGKNNQVQLGDTPYYFRVQEWKFIRHLYSNRNWVGKFDIIASNSPYPIIILPFEYVLDKVSEDIRMQLLFHLDLFS